MPNPIAIADDAFDHFVLAVRSTGETVTNVKPDRAISFAQERNRKALRDFLAALLAHPATHIALGFGILLLDFTSGSLLLFPILFVIPVTLSALYCSTRLAYLLATLLPFGRFLIATFVEAHASILANAFNALVRIAVLSLLAFLVALTARQNRQIKVLRGRLPICMWCKRIRDEGGHWESLEAYIATHSEADFTHGLCPECRREHYCDLRGHA